MQESEFASVIWDTKVPGDQEDVGDKGKGKGSGSGRSENDKAGADDTGVNISTQELMEDSDLYGSGHFGATNGGMSSATVAYGGLSNHMIGESSSRPSRDRERQDGAEDGDASAASANRSSRTGDVETEVTVTQPRKEGEGTSNPYITYLVTTTRKNQLTREIRRYALRRRFQDFVWLHEQLEKQFIGSVIPPLPGKHRMEYLTGDRFSEDFVNKRKHGLERFLRRVILHPSLRASEHLTVFLEARDWSSEYELKPKSENGMLDSIGDTLLNTFSKVRKRDERF
ncbi:intercellular trafficking and secretion, partial [Coemansia sp. RSA 2599]